MEKNQKPKMYKPGDVSQITGIGTDLLRKYADFFSIQTEWTQEPGKGHRRYSEENVTELIAIKEKINDQNWSWDKVLAWRNGEEDPYFKSKEEKSNLEKKMDTVLEELAEQKALTKTLIEALAASQDETRRLVERRDQQLLEDLSSKMEQRKRESDEEAAATQQKKKRFWLW